MSKLSSWTWGNDKTKLPNYVKRYIELYPTEEQYDIMKKLCNNVEKAFKWGMHVLKVNYTRYRIGRSSEFLMNGFTSLVESEFDKTFDNDIIERFSKFPFFATFSLVKSEYIIPDPRHKYPLGDIMSNYQKGNQFAYLNTYFILQKPTSETDWKLTIRLNIGSAFYSIPVIVPKPCSDLLHADMLTIPFMVLLYSKKEDRFYLAFVIETSRPNGLSFNGGNHFLYFDTFWKILPDLARNPFDINDAYDTQTKLIK